MLRTSCAAGTLLLLTTGAMAAEPAGAALALRAGAARVDITPPASALQHGDTIRDPLYVRAIVISNGATCAVLVGADQGNFADRDRRRSRAAGVEVDRLPGDQLHHLGHAHAHRQHRGA